MFLVFLASSFQVILEPPERLPCPPYVPLYRVVLLDGLGRQHTANGSTIMSEGGIIDGVLRLDVDYGNRIAYIVPVSDEVIFCDGME